jgi:hypothetical protein
MAAVLLPKLRWWIALFYVLAVFRAQLPLGTATLDLALLPLFWAAWVTGRALAANTQGAETPAHFSTRTPAPDGLEVS